MASRRSMIDNDLIEVFFSTVLKHILPKARYQSAGYFGPAEATRAGAISLQLSDFNEINEGSNYFYTNKYSFLHSTSVYTLLNIIKEKKIRLYNLCGMDDKEEFELSLRASAQKLSKYEIDEIKKRIFCFSMCEKDLEFKEESLPLWRSYAQDGNGVGLVFTFRKRYAKDWLHTMLSKVYYDKKHLEKFAKAESFYNEFRSVHGLSISNFDEMFYKYYSFHKSPIYKSEREVRLIYSEGFHSFDEPPVKYDITSRLKKTSYVELDLEWEMPPIFRDRNFRNLRPYITLDNIILGYRLGTNSAKWDLVDVIHTHSSKFKQKPEILDSPLLKHFNDQS